MNVDKDREDKKEERPSLPGAAGSVGNSSTTDPKAKRWCFTWNNYSAVDAVKEFFKERRATCYIFGKEIGENGTPHLQGYVEFKSDRRASTLRKLKGVHWIKARGTKQENADYCAKEGKWISYGKIAPTEKLDDPLTNEMMHSWQKDITALCLFKCIPHSREIYWLVGSEGAEGKTTWAKHMCIKYAESHGVLYVSGKANDMKHAIAAMLKEGQKAPKIIILGLPRSKNPEAVSYAGLEELKDGIFFSSKYESRMVLYNTPHVVVLANEEPARGKLSEDRLKVWDLNFLIELEKNAKQQLEIRKTELENEDFQMENENAPPSPYTHRQNAMMENELEELFGMCN